MRQDKEPSGRPGSYDQILRSSAILGGAQGLVYLMLIARTKVVAVILGPAGVGTFGLYQSIITFVSTISNLGIPTSGVREVANANQSGDPGQLPRCIGTLKRISWFTGILGWFLTAALAYPLCYFTFDSTEHALTVALLGSALVFTAISSAQMAILQGCRRIGDLARVQVLSTALVALVSIGFYTLLGTKGIVPSLIVGPVLQWCVVLWFGRHAETQAAALSWTETLRDSRQMILLGVAFMWNAVITGAVALAIRALIVRNLGLEANGIFQAAWALSGMFASFILSAMGTDFFPRLTAVASDHPQVNRLVNEQTEIGILLSLPGLLFTLALAPWLMQAFYSRQFIAGSELLPWFVLGIFGQIISWPLGYIQMAKSASRSFMITQTLFNGVHLALVAGFFHFYGLLGISIALPVVNALYTGVMLIYCHSLTGFRWSRGVSRMVLVSGLAVGAAFAVDALTSGIWATLVELALGLAASVLSLRGLLIRLPQNHRLRRMLSTIQARLAFCV